jgi:hypothetical protein
LWRPPREADGWQRVLFYRPPDRRVMVLWNHNLSTRTIEVNGTGPEATQLALGDDGSLVLTTVRPDGGKLRPTLPGATNRNNPGNHSPVMAGRPVILVERDAYAPFRATVKPLPASSAASFDVTISAADGGTGVGAFRIFYATAAPTSAAAWQPLVAEQAWTANPLSGEVTVRLGLAAGRSYWFAAQARDRAGNWSVLPASAQASTAIPGPTAPPATPTATPTRTATPTLAATALPTLRPWPTWTAGPPPPLPIHRFLPWASQARTTPAGGYPYPAPTRQP